MCVCGAKGEGGKGTRQRSGCERHWGQANSFDLSGCIDLSLPTQRRVKQLPAAAGGRHDADYHHMRVDGSESEEREREELTVATAIDSYADGLTQRQTRWRHKEPAQRPQRMRRSASAQREGQTARGRGVTQLSRTHNIHPGAQRQQQDHSSAGDSRPYSCSRRPVLVAYIGHVDGVQRGGGSVARGASAEVAKEDKTEPGEQQQHLALAPLLPPSIPCAAALHPPAQTQRVTRKNQGRPLARGSRRASPSTVVQALSCLPVSLSPSLSLSLLDPGPSPIPRIVATTTPESAYRDPHWHPGAAVPAAIHSAASFPLHTPCLGEHGKAFRGRANGGDVVAEQQQRQTRTQRPPALADFPVSLSKHRARPLLRTRTCCCGRRAAAGRESRSKKRAEKRERTPIEASSVFCCPSVDYCRRRAYQRDKRTGREFTATRALGAPRVALDGRMACLSRRQGER